MSQIAAFCRRILGAVFKLVLGLALAVFALSFLLAALLLLLLSSLWSLLNGRKPVPLLLLQQLRELSRRLRAAAWMRARPGRRASGSAEVLDIQALEVPEPAQPDRAPR
ncbi:hypothetical protein [Hydrogenophaga sp.]|uniref:hypothetical protein n=1 Tax=Hydrogenophaga sp. TaxID=1904254 RepID=UPI0019CA3944|nr:hypothetical protein [Hydrogenophaga sp.]MBD3893861.1 hypothetical protein [Hydrogenophaga sp.]